MKKIKKNESCDIKKDINEHINDHIDRKVAKTSLKKKVNRAMTASSAVTAVTLAMLFAFVLFVVVTVMTSVFVDYSANHVAFIVSNEWTDEGLDEETIGSLIDGLSQTDIMKSSEENINEENNFGKEINIILDKLIHYKVILIKDDIEYVAYDTEANDVNRMKYDSIREYTSTMTSRSEANIYNFPDMDKDHEDVSKEFAMGKMSNYESEDYKVGYIEASINPKVAEIFIAMTILFLLVVLLVNGVISSFMRFIFAGMITKPVSVIASQLQAISEGDIESSLNKEVIVKRPVKEVQIMMEATNKIIHKTKNYMDTMEEQNYELEAQKEELVAQNGSLEDRSNALTSMNDAYLSRTLNFQNLLDNVGQGFMTFGEDLKVNPEYSLACEHAVKEGESIEGEKITDVLSIEESDKEFVEDIFSKIFTSEKDKKELYTTLLPDEMSEGGHVFKIEYQHVFGIKGEAQMLVITTDITEQRLLESKVEEERNVLQMIVKVMMNRSEFINLHSELKEFADLKFNELEETLNEKILRDIHTLKGSFSQYYLNNISNYLDELETLIGQESLTVQELDGEEMINKFNLDLQLIEEYVGEEFFVSDDSYTIKDQKITDIEFKLKDLLPDYEFNKVLPLIQSIRHKPVQLLLNSYVDYTEKLSERLVKNINEVKISGDDVFVDNAIYSKVFKTLVHVFRNAVDHGIEDEEERLLSEKNPMATISCKVEHHGDEFKIIVEDDGRGIDLDKLISVAKEKGVYNDEKNDDIYSLLFKDGFTTQESASVISGRGVGLSAVKYAVEEIGGSIHIKSEYGQGTTFVITLPFISDTSLVSFSAEKLMDNVARISQDYLNTLGVSLVESDRFKSNKISLKRVNALISIKGAIEGVMFFSANEELGRALMNGFIIEDVAEENVTDYIEDVLGEVTNTVIGNVLGVLEEQGIYLTIGVPALISNKEAYMKYSETEILVTDFVDGDYELSLNLLAIDGNDGRSLLTGR